MARVGSMTLSWLPVSTMKSNGPVWLIITGITSRAPATIRGCMLDTLPGQCASAWLEMDWNANPMAKAMKEDAWSSRVFMSTSARWVRAEGDIGGYIWLPLSIGDKMPIKDVWKR